MTPVFLGLTLPACTTAKLGTILAAQKLMEDFALIIAIAGFAASAVVFVAALVVDRWFDDLPEGENS